MDRKKEISNDIWEIMRKVYSIGDSVVQSDRQAEFLKQIVEYIDTNLSTRRKKKEEIKDVSGGN
jgi:hypothetical protein